MKNLEDPRAKVIQYKVDDIHVKITEIGKFTTVEIRTKTLRYMLNNMSESICIVVGKYELCVVDFRETGLIQWSMTDKETGKTVKKYIFTDTESGKELLKELDIVANLLLDRASALKTG